MPWFTATGLRAELASGTAVSMPYKHQFNVWQISWPMAAAIVIAVLICVYALLQRDDFEPHSWPPDSIDMVWLCSFVVLTVAAVIVFKLTGLPGVDSQACQAAGAIVAAPTEATGCLDGLVPPITTHLDFAAVMSVVLTFVLMGCAGWATRLLASYDD